MGQEIKTVTKQVTQVCYACDWCGAKVISFHNRCAICGRYACIDHIEDWHCNIVCYDRPNYYCRECWEIGESSRHNIEKLKSNIGREERLWKAKCIKAIRRRKK